MNFGIAGFPVVASAVNNFSDIFSSTLLPGGGVGVRNTPIPSMKVNVGSDVSVGVLLT
jgi:hypothetical protein